MGRESALSRAEHAAGQVLTFDRLLPPQEIAEAIEAVGAADIAGVGERLLEPWPLRRRGARNARGPAAGAEFRHALFG